MSKDSKQPRKIVGLDDGDEDSTIIKLVTNVINQEKKNTKQTFKFPKEVAKKRSVLINNILEYDPEPKKNEIPLKYEHIPIETMSMAILFLKEYDGDAPQKPLLNYVKWPDIEEKSIKTLPLQTLIDLIKFFHYIDAQVHLNWVCAALASNIKGKNLEQIKNRMEEEKKESKEVSSQVPASTSTTTTTTTT